MARSPRPIRVALCALCLLGAASALTPAAARAEGAATDGERAALLFQQGNDAYKKKNWQAAYEAYSKAFALKRTYDIAGNLGDVELLLDKPRDAAEHLEFSLGDWPAGQREARARTEERLVQAKKAIVTLTIKVDVDGAEISVNGKEIGKSPHADPVFVDPGAIDIQVRAGDKTAHRTLAADRGEAPVVSLALSGGGSSDGATSKAGAPGAASGAPASSSPQPSDTAPAEQPSHGPNMRVIVTAAAGGLAVIGLGVGIGYALGQKSAKNDRDALRDQSVRELGQGGCATDPFANVCVDLRDANDSVDTRGKISTIGFVSAGVFAAAAAGAWFLWPREKAQAAQVRVVPALGARNAGVWLDGRF